MSANAADEGDAQQFVVQLRNRGFRPVTCNTYGPSRYVHHPTKFSDSIWLPCC